MLLSLVMPYYRNPRMLARQYLTWALEWPDALKRQVEIIIVDDGSPDDEAAAGVERLYEVESVAGWRRWAILPRLSIYRVTEDRPWHQHAARNLGAHVAAAPWLLMTDMDHVVPADTLAGLLAALEDCIFTFCRRDAPAGEPWRSNHWTTMARTVNDAGDLKPHVNSFALPRSLYWKIGGYDEEYCGIYGTDGKFRKRLFGAGVPTVQLPLPLIRVSRDVIPDASTRDAKRKEESRNHLKKAVEAAKLKRGEAHVIKTLQFPWERVI